MQVDGDEAQAGLELAALFERYAPGMLAYYAHARPLSSGRGRPGG